MIKRPHIFCDTSGNVAIIFAVTLPLLLGLFAFGIDLSRATRMRAVLADSIDSVSAEILANGIFCDRSSAPAQADFSVAADISSCPVGAPGGESAISFATRRIASQFTERGYETAPNLSPAIFYNPVTRRVALNATASYSCTLSQVLMDRCTIGLHETVGDAGIAATSQDGISLGTPPPKDIWLGETESPGLPTHINVAGGQPPYAFSIGPYLPAGLAMDPDTGSITGTPLAQSCVAPCFPQTRSIAVSATEKGAATKPRTAAGSVSYRLIHKLKLQVTQLGGETLSFITAVEGGVGPYRYSCSALPPGMACNPNTGVISGSPASGPPKGAIIVRVIDGRGKMAQETVQYQMSSLGSEPTIHDLRSQVGPQARGKNPT